jgi:DNA topoisomerase IA
LGKKVIDYIYKEHSECFNYEYTSKIEQYLDDIAEGKLEKDTLLKEIYEKLKK